MEGTGSTFWSGFLDWFAAAFVSFFGWLRGLYDELIAWTADVLGVIIGWVGASWQFTLDWFGSRWGEFLGLIDWLIALPAELITWLSVELEALNTTVGFYIAANTPSFTFFDTTPIADVVLQIKTFGGVLPVFAIMGALITGVTLVGTIIVFKLIWRSIPTIG